MGQLSEEAGVSLAFLSMLLNGLFSCALKRKCVLESEVSFSTFHVFFCSGVFLSCLMVLSFILIADSHHGRRLSAELSILGALSGFLATFAVYFSFASMRRLHMSVAAPIWSGIAIVVSFMEGAMIENDRNNSQNLWMGLSGITVIVFGIFGVAFSEWISQLLCMSVSERAALHERYIFSGGIDGVAHPSHAHHHHHHSQRTVSELGNGEFDHHPSSLNDPISTAMIGLSSPSPGTAIPSGAKAPHSSRAERRSHRLTSTVGGSEYPMSLDQSLPISTMTTFSQGTSHHIYGHPSTTTLLSTIVSNESKSIALSIAHDRRLNDTDFTTWLTGVLYGSLSGFCSASVGLPSVYADKHVSGVLFIPSLAPGVLIALLMIQLGELVLSPDPCSCVSPSKKALRETVLTGLLSGVIWNTGNACSLYAIRKMQYYRAYPIMQCALAVNVAIGVFVFRERTDAKSRGVLLSSCALTLLGCALLAMS